MSDSTPKHGFDTRAIHAGQSPDPTTGAVMTPIFATSTFKQRSPGDHTGYEYARTQNPTRHAFERCIADLEGGTHAYAFASGLAASGTVLELLDSGSHLVAVDDMYGGSWRLFERVRKRSMGLRVAYADPNKAGSVAKMLDKNTRMIWVETPSNPLLKVTDLAEIARLGKERGILTVVDNTFASPLLQRPLELGIDIVLHSVTKYINGHSDMVGGIVVVRRGDLAEKLEFMQNAIGSILDPFSCFLALRGVKTLPVRMRQHCDNAMQLAKWLHQHPKVEKTLYPGLPDHPQHGLAWKQMNGHFGAMISVYLKTDMAGVRRALEACQVFTLAESLGGVESLIGHPVTMSNGLVRLSVGIENIDDLTADLEQALAKI